ncbi:hypothetical protein [Streptococcus intermedius]|uniref:hypothetical protein n=1 Tax=Streptococcus intermedius TaxID=1338 RepID=UPI0034D96AD7
MCCVYVELVEILLNKMSACCGKLEVRYNCKVGHVTVVADDVDKVKEFGEGN